MDDLVAHRLDMTASTAGLAPVAVGRPMTMMIIAPTSEAGRTRAS